VALFEDETDVLLFPPLRSAWSARGLSDPVMLQGGNAKRVIFGAINIRTGHRSLLGRPTLQAEDFQFFLWQIRSEYRGWNIHMILDQHRSHKDHTSKALARKMGIRLLWLPKRAPKLNPMDHLWGKAKARMTANFQYETIDDVADNFVEHIQILSNQDALCQAGILSEKFWLLRPRGVK
jgi:transposase